MNIPTHFNISRQQNTGTVVVNMHLCRLAWCLVTEHRTRDRTLVLYKLLLVVRHCRFPT